jgi:hypothetical protein
MALSIPLPRRGLRSLFVLLILMLGPYMVLRHILSISSDSTEKSPSDPYFPQLRRKGGIDVNAKNTIAKKDAPSTPKTQRVIDRDTDEVEQPIPNPPKQKVLPKPKSKIDSSSGSSTNHVYRSNGLVEVNPEGQHPIFDLIDRAKTNWETKMSKASTSLGEAVDEYRRRYHRAPPKGFDRW